MQIYVISAERQQRAIDGTRMPRITWIVRIRWTPRIPPVWVTMEAVQPLPSIADHNGAEIVASLRHHLVFIVIPGYPPEQVPMSSKHELPGREGDPTAPGVE